MEERPRSGIWTGLMIVAACAPCLAAACFTQSVPEGRAVVGQVERPALAFMQHSLDLGNVNPVGTVPGYFDFWNQGEHPLEITELKPSCGCLGPRLSNQQRVFAPGERGRIYVSVATANETSGAKNYTVDVHYRELAEQNSASDHQKPLSEQVAFLMTIPQRKVTVSPAEVYFYQLTGQADHRIISVADHRGTQLEVVDATINSEFASITVGEPHTTEGGAWETPVRIDVTGDIPPGRKIAVATILTKDPEFSRIRVPILIEGRAEEIQLTSGESGAVDGNVIIANGTEPVPKPSNRKKSPSSSDHQEP